VGYKVDYEVGHEAGQEAGHAKSIVRQHATACSLRAAGAWPEHDERGRGTAMGRTSEVCEGVGLESTEERGLQGEGEKLPSSLACEDRLANPCSARS
jgi:hypothetical protein